MSRLLPWRDDAQGSGRAAVVWLQATIDGAQ
jgi:hypothetical protein